MPAAHQLMCAVPVGNLIGDRTSVLIYSRELFLYNDSGSGDRVFLVCGLVLTHVMKVIQWLAVLLETQKMAL